MNSIIHLKMCEILAMDESNFSGELKSKQKSAVTTVMNNVRDANDKADHNLAQLGAGIDATSGVGFALASRPKLGAYVSSSSALPAPSSPKQIAPSSPQQMVTPPPPPPPPPPHQRLTITELNKTPEAEKTLLGQQLLIEQQQKELEKMRAEAEASKAVIDDLRTLKISNNHLFSRDASPATSLQHQPEASMVTALGDNANTANEEEAESGGV